ncbi:TIM barrel protein [Lichenifustis flavocetrariae]|uniref:TIM barrel protein n=1 Tax=Lichenifustis flavocetrariae TaxID=2949735 RepID=A0AA41Z6C7_9HYPH|nr:TIM barrel protein [Lichenifustis flavocetrariae]MCW6510092.1 TIM barrel protein [Lichenifustis flavocetrariae]
MPLRFALNHMVCPRKSLRDFLALAQALGVAHVEIRNDLPGPITDGTSPETVKAEAAAAGVSIVSINALQRFNQWSPARAAEAAELVGYAQACGAAAIVLCPVNDLTFQPDEATRLAGLREALSGLAPMLRSAGLIGLVEPLGFAECSLRSKREAVEAIDAVEAADVFRLVHDTFHHHVAGEPALFPDRTGLVHVSGVVDPSVPGESMRDPHRVLVDAEDLIDNVGQIEALLAGGYAGPISLEPFAESVAALEDPRPAVEASLRYMQTEHNKKAA